MQALLGGRLGPHDRQSYRWAPALMRSEFPRNRGLCHRLSDIADLSHSRLGPVHAIFTSPTSPLGADPDPGPRLRPREASSTGPQGLAEVEEACRSQLDALAAYRLAVANVAARLAKAYDIPKAARRFNKCYAAFFLTFWWKHILLRGVLEPAEQNASSMGFPPAPPPAPTPAPAPAPHPAPPAPAFMVSSAHPGWIPPIALLPYPGVATHPYSVHPHCHQPLPLPLPVTQPGFTPPAYHPPAPQPKASGSIGKPFQPSSSAITMASPFRATPDVLLRHL
jgi:hypothetical protein